MASLHFLHSQCGIIHTDIKPENFLISFNYKETEQYYTEIFEQQKKLNEFRAKEINRTIRHEKAKQNFETQKKKPLSKKEKKKLKRKMKKLEKQLQKRKEEQLKTIKKGVQKQSEPANLNQQKDIVEDNSGKKMRGNSMKIRRGRNIKKTPYKKRSLSYNSLKKSSKKDQNPKKKKRSYKGHKFLELLHEGNFQFKLIDFSNACWTHHQFSEKVTTRPFRAPEILLGMKYGKEIDLWAAGCLFYQMMTNDFLFNPRSGNGFSKDEDHLAQILEIVLSVDPFYLNSAPKKKVN